MERFTTMEDRMFLDKLAFWLLVTLVFLCGVGIGSVAHAEESYMKFKIVDYENLISNLPPEKEIKGRYRYEPYYDNRTEDFAVTTSNGMPTTSGAYGQEHGEMNIDQPRDGYVIVTDKETDEVVRFYKYGDAK